MAGPAQEAAVVWCGVAMVVAVVVVVTAWDVEPVDPFRSSIKHGPERRDDAMRCDGAGDAGVESRSEALATFGMPRMGTAAPPGVPTLGITKRATPAGLSPMLCVETSNPVQATWPPPPERLHYYSNYSSTYDGSVFSV
ncbi:hypothetical protein QBC39DRAFT_327198 [Podospora conica]|nr:hypothetical protein QBC39DRAFT_327198 [Schizothecium conicum]